MYDAVILTVGQPGCDLIAHTSLTAFPLRFQDQPYYCATPVNPSSTGYGIFIEKMRNAAA